MTSELLQCHGNWDCLPLKLLFVIEKQAFLCLSHWYLTFMLYTKISLNNLFSMSFKNMSQLVTSFLNPTPWLLISLEIKSQVLTIIKPLILSLTLSSSFTLLQLFCEYTKNTLASGLLHILSYAWNISLQIFMWLAHLFNS